jgi:hypothetical protein
LHKFLSSRTAISPPLDCVSVFTRKSWAED